MPDHGRMAEIEHPEWTPVAETWRDYIVRSREQISAEPYGDDPNEDNAWRDAMWQGSLVAGIYQAIASLELRLVEIRDAIGMRPEGDLPPPQPWSLIEPLPRRRGDAPPIPGD